MRVPASTAATAAHSFSVASSAFDHLDEGPPPLDERTDDSANASGSHRVGALSNYNACREGFIFSNGDRFGVDAVPDFAPATDAFFSAAVATVRAVLGAIERRLEIPAGWFDAQLGPLDKHAQWHLKRYVPAAAPKHATTSDGKLVLLAVHSDPSILSLVFHDALGVQEGARGLECQVPQAAAAADGGKGGGGGMAWQPVACHGHGVVTVLAGSLLDRLTHKRYPAVRHRVAVPALTALESGRRVAATFFFRPAPSALLKPPPSPKLPKGGGPPPVKFAAWQKKVADKYERHKPPAVLPPKPGASSTTTETDGRGGVGGDGAPRLSAGDNSDDQRPRLVVVTLNVVGKVADAHAKADRASERGSVPSFTRCAALDVRVRIVG